MADELAKIGHLVMRREGGWWVAYYAKPDNMNGAVELGRVKTNLIEGRPNERARMEAFMGLMRDSVSELVFDALGVRPVWPHGFQPAHEHERAGRGVPGLTLVPLPLRFSAIDSPFFVAISQSNMVIYVHRQPMVAPAKGRLE